MKKQIDRKVLRRKRQSRQRERKLFQGTAARPRLCIYRSLKHIYVQMVNDEQSQTLLGFSTLSSPVKDKVGGKKNISAAKIIGELAGQQAQARGIKRVVFDRSGYLYHGWVKALAEAVISTGLKF